MIGKIVPVKFCKFELADAASDQRISHEHQSRVSVTSIAATVCRWLRDQTPRGLGIKPWGKFLPSSDKPLGRRE